MNHTAESHPPAAARRFFIHTFGCQMNDYDSRQVARMLGRLGYEPTADPSRAALIVINTCAVRAKAEQKAFSFLGRLHRLKAGNPRLTVVVAGCMAQQYGGDLLERFPHVDLVLGSRSLSALPDFLERRLESGSRLVFLEDSGDFPMDNRMGPYRAAAVVAPVTIMQGCDNFCSYCVVPFVRGRERSRPADVVIEEIEHLVASGVREVVLLGQNVNSYGQTGAAGISFPQLLRRIHAHTGVARLRFTTSHPKDLSAELIACFAELDRLCAHLHLPFQAGSDAVLARMNRGYTAADYVRKVARLRRACPSIGISADVMVGFPGETEEDFRQTLHLLEQVRFDMLFSFRYSDRPNTRAAQFPEKVPEAVKARRLVELQAAQAAITLSKNGDEIGGCREILVEGPSKAGGGQWTGRTRQNRTVNFSAAEDLTGRLVMVRVTSAFSHSLKGELVP